MGDHDECQADLVVQVPQLDLHLLAQIGVERRQRLVEQQHLGTAHDGAGQRHALLLAAGEFGGIGVRLFRQADQGQRLGDARPDIAARRTGDARGRSRRSGRPSCGGKARSPGKPCSPRACSAGHPVTSSPSSQMVPLVGVSKPPIRRSTVDFPQPEGPSSVTYSPRSIVSDTSATATTSPNSLRKFSIRMISDTLSKSRWPEASPEIRWDRALEDARSRGCY